MSDLPNNSKVLIAIPVLFVGGTEIHTLNLVKTLTTGGYHVSVCCYYDHDIAMVSKFKETGAEIILMGLRRPEGLLPLFIELINLFKKLKPGTVHVQYIAPGLIPIIAAKAAGIKRVFATVHQPGTIYRWKHKMFVRIAAHLCDAFFCNSRSVEESWFGESQVFDVEKIDFKRKHFSIYNGVDVARIERIGKEVDREKIKDLLGIKNRRVIGVVGRLRKEKGQAALLESMKTIIQELADTVLLVVGDGPDRSYLQEIPKKLNIDGRVKWLGKKDHDEVLRLYSIMDVVVVPSLFEGFGLTAAEAMAAGKPVVASNVDGLSEVIIDNVTGYLVPAKDCVVMARRLVELLSNKQKAETMGQAGFQRVTESFGMERFAASISGVYHFYAD
jgi:glycosyltransferase involved in cell wall biosynthesis